MPKVIDALSDSQVDNAVTKEKPYKLCDGGGLFLLVTSTGSKLWRTSYRFLNKRQDLSLGTYPEVSLAEARSLNADIRSQLARGINPSAARTEQKSIENTNNHISDRNLKISVYMDGTVEIMKGRTVLYLTQDESRFVKDQLNLLR